ncbi:MAG: glycosyltransferase [Candidatus Doudnabacteria bacterium]|nr:glycosyltransferase [Candidatus Doudnabacteria bacterium]
MTEFVLQIYTEEFFLTNRLKSLLKKIFGVDSRGPQAVVKSLINGLKELDVKFSLNKRIVNTGETVCILNGAKTLKWAISQKQQGKIKKIIAGPNIVISPYDKEGLIKSKEIDIIIVPSQWVKDYYLAVAPELSSKIRIWAAGVNWPEEKPEQKDIEFLVYNKIGKNPLKQQIVQILDQRKLSYRLINYGQLRQKEYFKFLKRAKYEIYLSNSESQGLAMFEAWARGVPTLVWENGHFSEGDVKIIGKISGPFVSPENGMSFTKENFAETLTVFLKTNFNTANYIRESFTNKIIAQKYINICHG